MTTKITIRNDEAAGGHSLRVSRFEAGAENLVDATDLIPGDEVTLHVWGAQFLIVSEAEAAKEAEVERAQSLVELG